MKYLRAFALCASLLTFAYAMTAASQAVFGPWGITLADMDPSVDPGNDFFRYTNGGWLKTAVIPADRQYAGVNLELNQRNETQLKSIVATLTAKPGSELSAEERKLRDLYNAFENTGAIDAAGLGPVRKDLDHIAAIRTYRDVATFLGSPATQVGGPFRINITIDKKKPEAYIVDLAQYGLGMPDRDYYLRDDKESVAIQQAYKKYIADMLAFAGIHDAARSAGVYALEQNIAQVHWPAAERREAEKVYNPMTITELESFAPRFPWRQYFAAAGVSTRSPQGERVVVVREKSAFPKLAEVFAATPLSAWRDYLTVRYLHARAGYLQQSIDDTDFGFYGTTIGGQKKVQLPHDLRGIHFIDEQMGEALGKLYVARYFPALAKSKIQELVANLLKAYEADIQSLPWMTSDTRLKALEKIRRFTPKVGYPDKWRDYSALSIAPGKLVQDATNARVFEWKRELRRIDQPVDRGEWSMTPPTNNAYYNATLNEIVFPAGILQPPYFDPNADEAVNYGAIGAIIGHEISHGFDDQGSKSDSTGRLNNWWTDEDRRNFDARTAVLASQYNQYQPLPDLHINGKLTLGENIADLAGLVIAYKAYHLALEGKPAPVLDGYTGDQRFYIAYGQSWREIWTDGLTRRVVLSNPHAPSAARVNGVVRNDSGWYAAFPQVKSGDAYYLPPDARVTLW